MINELEEVIAMRILDCPTATNEELVILIGKPVKFEDSDNYRVPYQIKGAGIEKVKFVGGVDAIQCLQLVMKAIGAELWRLDNTFGGIVTWNGERGDFGFPN